MFHVKHRIAVLYDGSLAKTLEESYASPLQIEEK